MLCIRYISNVKPKTKWYFNFLYNKKKKKNEKVIVKEVDCSGERKRWEERGNGRVGKIIIIIIVIIINFQLLSCILELVLVHLEERNKRGVFCFQERHLSVLFFFFALLSSFSTLFLPSTLLLSQFSSIFTFIAVYGHGHQRKQEH